MREETGGFDPSEEKIRDNIYGETEIDDENDLILPGAMNVDDVVDGNIDPLSPQLRDLTSFQANETRFCDGYDTEGNDGPEPLPKPLVETVYESDEEFVPTAATAAAAAATAAAATATANADITGELQHLTDAEIEGMTITVLRHHLKFRRCPSTQGNKGPLQERLKKAIKDGLPIYTAMELKQLEERSKKKKAPNTTAGLKSFPQTAYWRELVANKEVEQEPTNPTFINARGPTTQERDANVTVPKHSFAERFDIPLFTGRTKKIRRSRNGRIVWKKELVNDKRVPEYDTTTRTKGCVNPKFKKKHKLSSKSLPHEIADVFLPLHRKGKGLFPLEDDGPTNTKVPKWRGDIQTVCDWTNLKADLAGAGPHGGYYRDFVKFTPEEIRKHIAVYILHSLSPSPQLAMKFNTQVQDEINGNDFIANSIGPGGRRRHQMFRAFLSFQDPRIPVSSKTTKDFPNWKIRPILTWMNYIFPTAWLLGVAIAIDEMTMGFQGRHGDKKRITYKNEGDGFQADALAQEGYCYQFHMRNDPAPRKYSAYSPLHARVMALFDSLEEKYHHAGFDNLYNSASFCRASFNHNKKVLCHGVTRKGGRGIPDCVKQDEVKNRTKQLQVRGTVKAAKLEGDPGCPSLLATSVYDSKPVHYLSMISEQVKWVVKEKEVFNKATRKMEPLKFLRLNQIDTYNYGMGSVDVADQLRVFYRLDHWLRNRKWWWSIVFWAIGVILTNSYVLYTKMCDEDNIPPQDRISHYNFLREIGMYWLNPTYMKDKNPAVYNNTDTFMSPESNVSDITTDSATTTSTLRKRKRDDSSTTSSKRQGREHITDSSLLPTGKYTKRLFNARLHFPQECVLIGTNDKGKEVRKQPACALHGWLGKQSRNKIMHCSSCNVNLCIDCYNIFHTEADLVAKKDELKDKYGIK